MALGNAAIIETRDRLKAYIKRQLGWPVINIEIHDSQIEDAINETVAEFLPYAYDGVQRRFGVLTYLDGTQEYDMGYPCLSVQHVAETNMIDYAPSTSDLFSVEQHIANDFLKGGMGKLDLITLELTQEMISTLSVIFGKRVAYDYNSITKKLYLHQPYADGQRLIVELFRSIDYDNTDNSTPNRIYDIKWVQQYSSALARRQWGYNMMKYEGSTLPNGLVINSAAILAEAKENITELKEQLHEEWELPVDFFVG